MKLNKKYIIDKVDKLIYSIDWEWNSPNEKIFEEIVMSIVRDSYNAGAEAQKVADEVAVKSVFELADNGGKMAMFMCAISGIQSAAVTFEEGK